MEFDLAGKRVWIAGHRGMVGSALVRRLGREDGEILTVAREECDLCRQAEVERWLGKARPDVVVVAAARVGGILAKEVGDFAVFEDRNPGEMSGGGARDQRQSAGGQAAKESAFHGFFFP